mgnify:CR=1 FL=1
MHCVVLYGIGRIVHHKMVDNKEVTMKHLDKLANWLNTLHVGFRDGDPMKPLSVLPDYYQAADEKVKHCKAVAACCGNWQFVFRYRK